MTRRSWLLVIPVIGAAFLLAFPLRPMVERTVIVPVAYVLWVVRLFYGSLPQLVWWIAALLAVLLIGLGTLLPPERFRARAALEAPGPLGSVESLALWIRKTRGGTYYKWLVAHRLGMLARAFARGSSNGSALPLDSWRAQPSIREYFEVGLYGSFARYPGSAGLLRPAKRTPLDVDIAEVVEALETRTETDRG